MDTTISIFIIVAIVLVVLYFLLFSLPNNPFVPGRPSKKGYGLQQFENYYLTTLNEKFAQKAEKIANPTRAWVNDGNIFQGLQPWETPIDFGIAMHTLIGYGVRFRTPTDSLFLDAGLAANLYNAIVRLHQVLPYPPPNNSAPWGPTTDWYHFAITMPEALENTAIVLRGYYNIDQMVTHILNYYLPEPTWSLNWRRTAGNAMRMGLPYIYGQLLRGYTFGQIQQETEVAYVINLIRFALVAEGDGIHFDYVYFDHTDVRAYGYLINSFFTFSYYDYLFDDVVNMNNLYNAINVIGCSKGYTNPAILARQGSNWSEVIGTFLDYKNEVVSADLSKILTIRTNDFFGSVVGQAPDVAYYEADENNSNHAPLWAMCRKIWANDGDVIRYRSNNLGIESGIILVGNLNGITNVPSTGPSTSSFHPTIAETAICTTTNVGLMAMHVRFEELNIEFESYTFYHPNGMLQLYKNVRTLTPITANARCVIITKDLSVQTAWSAVSNFITSNKITAKQHGILNDSYGFSNFALRALPDLNMQSVEQLISADRINEGTGKICYSLLVEDTAATDDTVITKMAENVYTVRNDGGRFECVYAFPIVIVKDNETKEVSINDALSTSTHNHLLNMDKVSTALNYVSLTIEDLVSSNIKQIGDYFNFQNRHQNQFKFRFL
ncbi:Odv-e66b [Ectropis obliqua nucleopolyhedrovirus]|uniref:Occlusion-derived virus envelope protein E66 n=1 Tax=Ectropis obliqua nucleopolyhedrovirus TaxID=59376 RepID=A0EYV1_9ABAC|nr:Odv-e66b [Ectropis obliqua nucleopolyhedrovirus]ABI35731.1 Odv-e66b [Ectropis obliqua nucleopolyhedrovirus]AGS47904.1 occlusion-derived virus envelope protein E66 [Ectropis obliqua nucleopolyhedrovirus]QWV59683.1 Odv-e66b [Ectropis obliqua nucleopolyhedrovirus]UYO72846.1 Odv-e66b [Ectropis obliqua nucleopolyhedrovirus]